MIGLTAEDLDELYKNSVQTMCANREEFGPMAKAELRAAFDAVYQFMVTNATAINNAYPEPVRSALNTRQKYLIFANIVKKIKEKN